MRTLILALVVLVSCSTAQADELPTNFKSPEVNKLIETFKQQKKSAGSLVAAKVRANRRVLMENLKTHQEAITKAGDLDEALKIKSLIGQLSAAQEASQEFVVQEGENSAGKTKIPQGAVKFGTHYYYIVTEAVPWHVAKSRCGLSGGHLLRIDTIEEQVFITKLIQPLVGKPANLQWLWIDGNDEEESKVYRDSTGKKLEFLPWHSGYPKEFDRRFYLVINVKQGQIANTFSNRTYFICEWE